MLAGPPGRPRTPVGEPDADGTCGKPGTQAPLSDLGRPAPPGLALQRRANRCPVAAQARPWPLGMTGTKPE